MLLHTQLSVFKSFSRSHCVNNVEDFGTIVYSRVINDIYRVHSGAVVPFTYLPLFATLILSFSLYRATISLSQNYATRRTARAILRTNLRLLIDSDNNIPLDLINDSYRVIYSF